MATNPSIILILEKIASKDKDFRYMATNDLQNELAKDSFKVNADTERQLCAAVLAQLEDISGDISGLAVKCLSLLMRRVGQDQALDLVRQLCDRVTLPSKKEQQRDIAAIGLRTIIAELPSGPLADAAAAAITQKMLAGIKSKDGGDIVDESMQILHEALARFGGHLAGEHGVLRDALLPALEEPRAGLRKRAMNCVAALAAHLNDEALAGVVEHVLGRLKAKGAKPDAVRTYVQTVAQLSRAVGFRLGPHLPAALPLLLQHCDAAGEGDEELREHCLQALESFVLRCASDVRPQLDTVLAASLKYLKHDPNYEYDESEGGDEEMADEGEEDEGSEEAYSDDEDASWKVRRAAAKALAALPPAFPDLLPHIYKRAAPELVARFREREENVKGDVFHAYSELVKQVGATAPRYAADAKDSPLALLRSDVPAVVKAAARQLAEKSAKTRVGAMAVLCDLVAVVPEGIASNAGALLPGILAALQDRSANTGLKIQALQLLRLAMAAAPAAAYQPHLPRLAPGVIGCAQERYYKVVAEALRVCESIVAVLRPEPPAPVPSDLVPVVAPLFEVQTKRLAAQDQDQEVKEAAILGVGVSVARFADALPPAEVQSVLKLLLERLRNETTRISAVRALGTIARSPLAVDASAVLEPALQELGSFLRKTNRALRQASLSALEALVAKHGAQLAPAALQTGVEEAATLIADSDLSMAAGALRLFVTLLGRQAGSGPTVVQRALPPAMALLQSPLLQGAAAEALQGFFAALLKSGAPQASYDTLLKMLLDAGLVPGASKAAQHNIAACVAALTASAGDAPGTVGRLLSMLKSSKDVVGQRLALLCVGEIGRHTDLGANADVEAAVMGQLQSSSEEIKAAAAAALGGVVCGNLGRFLPSLLSNIEASRGDAKRHYLLLQALGEVVACAGEGGAAASALAAPEASRLLELLLGSCEGEEECRNVAAECMGRLALLHPAPVVSALHGRLSSLSANVRCCVVSALKQMVVEKDHPVDEQLRRQLLDFLRLMGDADRHVRKAAVTSLTAAAHGKPALVAPHLAALLPLLCEQTKVRPELIRTVDLGPFKHKIDDGLDGRKAAFECLDMLLDACRGQLDAALLLNHVETGLNDEPDVKGPAFALLAKLAAQQPALVLSAAERIATALENTLTARLKSDAVKQEIDRHEDLLRACLRAVDAIQRLPGADGAPAWQAFVKRTVLAAGMKERYAQVVKERTEAEGGEA